ncbi:hypothetical protein H6P81_010059 [Aristolochia fimbriata]|uniref:Uncharacterized protein n=1 Tax=Aristolochia fimbriata TaxID=158543 RepID=A0AAV7ENB0_ARIFI|nr:hypothetical protein H6P81_010059 [Aristolochia fimbriata]
MSQQNIFPAAEECEQDISDGEDFDRVTYNDGCSESLQSLYQKDGKSKNSVASQLEILEGRSKFSVGSCGTNYDKIDTSVSLEGLDEPACPNSSFRPEDVKLQRDQHFSSDGRASWCVSSKESGDLGYLTGTSCHFAAQRVQKGRGGKARPRFSLYFQSCKEESSLSSIPKNRDENMDVFKHRGGGHSVADLLEDFVEENERNSEAPQSSGHSMAELLEGLHEKNCPSGGKHKMIDYTKKKRNQFVEPLSVLGSRILDNEDPVEPMESETSDEDEVDGHFQIRSGAPKANKQTMADLFQEAFSAVEDGNGTDFPNHKYGGIGFYGRLQQILQNEKDKHTEFLKQMQAGEVPLDDATCLDVKIISRCLDAKLTVCDCMDIQFTQGTTDLVDDEVTRKMTIIFSPRICNNVELEAGNFVRIHPPWKKVKVEENKIIILCTYFSQHDPIK